jgi:hypothetical protein
MITAEKPTLDEELLMHFGIRGMKWGVRKQKPSGGSSSKKGMSTKKKVAIAAGGLAVVAGVAATAYLLKTRGGVKVPKIGPTVNRVTNLPPVPKVPSPFEMRLQAGMSAHRTAMNRVGAQQITDKAWRDQAKIAKMARDMEKSNASLLGNLDDIRRKLAQPNHVWKL